MTTRTGAPVTRPTVRIDGQEYATVRELVLGMEMVEVEGGLSRLELRLRNYLSSPRGRGRMAFEDNQILKLGAAISVYGGEVAQPREIFRGLITGLEGRYSEGEPELVVLAEDALQRARMARRTATHTRLTIKGLAEQVAAVCGLKPVVDGFTTEIGPQVQLNESDLAFLRRLLVRHDGDLQVVGAEIHVSPRSAVHRGTIDLEMHEELRRVRVLADLTHQVTEVTVTGWDAGQGRRISVTRRGAGLGPGHGSTGARLLSESVFGSRPHHLSHPAVRDEAEAGALANAAYDARARRFVTLDATCVGQPEIRVGTHVNLTGLGDRFDNTYYVVEARHRFAIEPPIGYVTEFRAECGHWVVG